MPGASLGAGPRAGLGWDFGLAPCCLPHVAPARSWRTWLEVMMIACCFFKYKEQQQGQGALRSLPFPCCRRRGYGRRVFELLLLLLQQREVIWSALGEWLAYLYCRCNNYLNPRNQSVAGSRSRLPLRLPYRELYSLQAAESGTQPLMPCGHAHGCCFSTPLPPPRGPLPPSSPLPSHSMPQASLPCFLPPLYSLP